MGGHVVTWQSCCTGLYTDKQCFLFCLSESRRFREPKSDNIVINPTGPEFVRGIWMQDLHSQDRKLRLPGEANGETTQRLPSSTKTIR